VKHNVQGNPPKTIPEPLQKTMNLTIPRTFKEANGFGSGLAACYGLQWAGSGALGRCAMPKQSELSVVHQSSMTPHDENSLASRLLYRSQRSFQFAIQFPINARSQTLFFPPRLTVRQIPI